MEVSLWFIEDVEDLEHKQKTGDRGTFQDYLCTFLSSFCTTGSLRTRSLCPAHNGHSINLYYIDKWVYEGRKEWHQGWK